MAFNTALYFDLCRQGNIDQDEFIVDAVRKAAETGILDLSHATVNTKQCIVLAQCIAADNVLTEIHFSDCLLTDEAARAILNGVAANQRCEHVYLRGNNIRGASVLALARVLRENKQVRTIQLEFNQLGVDESAFVSFCDALSINETLEDLDLRNNDLHHATVAQLARALRVNRALRVLDLRWNAIGLLGGRAIYDALSGGGSAVSANVNRTLERVELAGCDVPSEMLAAIACATQQNAERRSAVEQERARSELLTVTLGEARRERQRTVTDLLTRFDTREAEWNSRMRGSGAMLKELETKLEERRVQITNLSAQCSLLESQVAVANGKRTDLESALERAARDRDDLERTRATELLRERSLRDDLERRLAGEINSLRSAVAEAELRAADSDRKAKFAQEDALRAREELAALHSEMRVRLAEADERAQLERTRANERIREIEHARMNDCAALRKEASEAESLWRDKISRLDEARGELADELAKLKQERLVDRLNLEEQVFATQKRCKAEEEARCSALEERLRLLQVAKEELVSQTAVLNGSLNEAQSRNSQLQLEIDVLRRRLDESQQLVAEKQKEVALEANRVRLEYEQRIQRYEHERASYQQLLDRVSQLETQLQEEQKRHKAAANEKESEMTLMQERLKLKEGELQRMIADEQQRISGLQHALLQYCRLPGSSPAPASAPAIAQTFDSQPPSIVPTNGASSLPPLTSNSNKQR